MRRALDIFPVFQHGGYDKSLDLSPDDIAVVRLDKAATVDGTYVDTVRLPAADDGNLLGAKCTITGWGKTKIGKNIGLSPYKTY